MVPTVRLSRLISLEYLYPTMTPRFYVPYSSVTPACKKDRSEHPIHGTHEKAYFVTLSVRDKTIDRAMLFVDGPLKDLLKVDFPALDSWFEEDVPIYQHPKDPYKRIDVLHSTRSIRVEVDGVTLAASSSPLFLLETSLRVRYYLPPTSIEWKHLSKSDTITYCPYKGRAEYYNVTVNEKTYRDVVWYYQYPTAESAAIAGHICFFNEKVDVWVDGVKEGQ